MNFFKKLWIDECGAIISTEAVLAAGMIVWGISIGLENLRDAVNKELTDLGNQIGSLNNSFTITGVSSNHSSVSGSSYTDNNQKVYVIQEK